MHGTVVLYYLWLAGFAGAVCSHTMASSSNEEQSKETRETTQASSPARRQKYVESGLGAGDAQRNAELICMKSALSKMELRLGATEDELLSLKKELANGHVAFSAFFTETGRLYIGKSAPIPFSHVTTNIGNGYDPTSGVFTAPVTGTYLFLLHARANGAYTRLELVKSGSPLTYLQLFGDHYKAFENGGFITTHVNAGEKVFVKHSGGGTSIDKWRDTAFTGILLFAD